jgi:palmitoyltransferase
VGNLAALMTSLGVAVPVLLSWHLYLISHGETSIESHDNAYLEDKAASDGLVSTAK